jgi:adenine-specific DNA-methyltransferase
MAKLGEKYLSGQIITYMGNKRKLLPIIGELVDKIQMELGRSLTIGDGFAGSGIVSRLLKTKASELYTNDLAGYSRTLNTCYLATPDAETLRQIEVYVTAANKLASAAAGTSAAGTQASAAGTQASAAGTSAAGTQASAAGTSAAGTQASAAGTSAWISGNWAPATPEITEHDRVYFTYENGKRIDVLRDYITTLPPLYQPYLLAPLLVECSIHNNTNGQFSAFYKDANAEKGAYGGKGSVDLKRIIQPITLPLPLFDPHPCKTVISQMDTNAWAKNLKQKLDIVYYDPPYNKHPYNIYYFLLDIINTWDKTIPIPATNRGQPDDRVKSVYNSFNKATEALEDLLIHTKASYIILSYNDGGIIPIPTLDALLAKHGEEVNKIPIDHKTYNRLKGISNYKREKEYKAVKEFMYVVKKK